MSYDLTIKLADEIVERRKKTLQDKIKRYPASNFRASDISECDKYMIYSILDWQKKKLHDVGLQEIFDAGNEEEKQVKKRLAEDGFDVVSQQNDFEIKDRNQNIICRGHIDGKISYKGEYIPIEIKSMNENIFRTINSLEDFNKKPHLRKYLRQMQLYLYGNNEEAGLFILSDFRRHKIIPVILDFGECDFILKRLEKIWEYVQKKEYPPKIEYKKDICGRCSYSHICLPDVENKSSQMIDNEELEQTIDKHEELYKNYKEYKSIHGQLKETFNNVESAFIGSKYQIVGKTIVKKLVNTKSMPDDVKKKYTEEKSEYRFHIETL
jgi:CRISPR/Cas system-associated exonuclease Cas4 (RecB family)